MAPRRFERFRFSSMRSLFALTKAISVPENSPESNKNRTINITIHDKPIKTLGSLKLPMEEIRFDFDGFTEQDADLFMTNYREHNLRCGGG